MISNHMYNVDHGIKSTFLSHGLLNTGMGKVHSVFKSSFNVVFRGQLVHIGKIEQGISAFGLVVSTKNMDEMLTFIEMGNKVAFHEEKILIYSKTRITKIHIQKFREFDCRIRLIKNANPLFLEEICLKLEKLNIQNKIGLDNVNTEIMIVAIHSEFNNRSLNKQLIQFLLGRGKGLTPSGDDILMGIYILLYSLSDSSKWCSSLNETLFENKTTDVSYAYYQALLSGYTSSPFIEFLNAIRNQDETKLDKAIENITMYGHTSGWDTLYGIYMAIKSGS